LIKAYQKNYGIDKKVCSCSGSETGDLDLAALELPSQLLLESSDLDSVEVRIGPVEFVVLFLGEFEELSVESPLQSPLHFLLVLGTALRVFSADVAAQRLRTSEEFVALIASKLFLIFVDINQIESIVLDLHFPVPRLR